MNSHASKRSAEPPTQPTDNDPWIIPFDRLRLGDVARVGGKNAALGEMVGQLREVGVRVPQGFATTAAAFRRFLDRGGLGRRIAARLENLDTDDLGDLAVRARDVRSMILETPLGSGLEAAILSGYAELGERYGEAVPDVAVRSSATAEDLPGASFAGQQETFLNVRGKAAVLDACRRCFASLYTDRAIAYRAQMGFADADVALSIGVQKMVRADLGAAGVIFTLDPETGFRDVVLITAAYGLGEAVVGGSVDPDEYVVFKPTLAAGFRPIVRRHLGGKATEVVYVGSDGADGGTETRAVEASVRRRFALGDDEVLQLARWAIAIESHFSQLAGMDRPMDIEWARDGRDGELYILQARPETVHAGSDRSSAERHRLLTQGEVLVSGRAVGMRIGIGPVRRVTTRDDLVRVAPGDVLVAEMTDPDWVPAMRHAAAVVTERGGRTCHAAIVSRELGLPAVVGATGALEALDDDDIVTVSCAEGEIGRVYRGRLETSIERVEPESLPRTRTKVLMNIADPDRAFDHAAIGADGVGLARMEFIISNAIGIHPMALVRFPDLDDAEDLRTIVALTAGYERKTDYFVDRLAEGIATIAAAFYPREVIVRLSDFKTNEYAGLVGGKSFEPVEENPMLGFRGASRYHHPRYAEGFALECAAVGRVRREMGLVNVKLMIPFCRSVAEARRVLATMAKHSLSRGEDGLEIYVMCELPTNVVLAERFAEVFDGFSIGSNDLTQLVLGVDRDSALVADLFDENDEAVREMIRWAIVGAHRAGRPIGLCGQAPSDDPSFAAFLVECGVDSVSVTPDAVHAARRAVAEAEASLAVAEAIRAETDATEVAPGLPPA